MKTPKPASHNLNNFKDVEAIGIVTYILSRHRRAIPKLDSVDKWPNIDGIIDFQNAEQLLIGKFEAQVKTLNPKHNYSYPIPVSFISYCDNVAHFPVLLLLVDKVNEKVFWIHMHADLIASTNYKLNEHSVNYHIKKDDFFDKENKDYLLCWEKIIKESRLIKRISDKIHGFIVENEIDVYNFEELFDSKIIEILISSENIYEEKVSLTQDRSLRQEKLEVYNVKTHNELDQFFNVNLYNEHYDLLLGNIKLSIDNRRQMQDGSILVTLSNKDQIEATIQIKFEILINNMKPMNTKINFSAMKKDSALNQINYIKFLNNIKKQNKLVAYKIGESTPFFEGSLNTQELENISNEEIEFLKSIVDIERRLHINLILPVKSDRQDIERVENLSSIIKTGKLELPELTVNSSFEDHLDNSKFPSNSTFMFSFSTTEKYEVFGMMLDLGEQLYILPRVNVEEVKGKELKIKTQEGHKNIIIYKDFYGHYSLEEIMKREKMGKFER